MKYHQFVLFETPRWISRVYQEPTRIGLSLGVDISEHGWRHPLFHIRFLIWEWDLEIDYSEPEKPSEFEKLIQSIREGAKVVKKSVNS